MSWPKPPELLEKIEELNKKIESQEKELASFNKQYSSLKKDFDNSNDEIKFLKKRHTKQRKTINEVKIFITTVLIVCFITFVWLVIDAWRFHGNEKKDYQQTIEQLKNENFEIKVNQIFNSRLDSIKNHITDTTK